MSEEERNTRKPASGPPPPPPARDEPLVPRATESGLHAALDALLPSIAPATSAVPPPLPAARRRPADDSAPFAFPRAEPATDSVQPPIPFAIARAPGADPGADAAYRAVPRRTPPGLRRPELGFGAPELRVRGELLEHLAARSAPGLRGKLLIAAAEAWQRVGESARARSLYEAAEADRPDDLALLRELRKYALADGDLDRAAALLQREAALPLADGERALVFLLLGELELRRGERDGAQRAAEQSFAAQPNIGAALLQYSLHARAGRDRDAADQLRRAAALCADSKMQSALLLHAARLLFRCGEPVAAQVQCQRAHDADASAIDALLCWVRAARERGDLTAALQGFERLRAAFAASELGDHALRACARLHDAASEPGQAVQRLAEARSAASLRLRARLCEITARPAERRAALERWAELAGGSERALALCGVAELFVGEGDVTAAQRAVEGAIAADPGSPLVRALQTAVTRATSGSVRPAARPTEGDDAERLAAAARVAADATAAAEEWSLLSALHAKDRTALALALDVAAERKDVRTVAAALADEARQLAGAERHGLEAVLAEWLAQGSHADAGAGDVALPRSPGSLLGALQQTYAARDPVAAGGAWLELSALLSGEPAAAAATLAGDYLAASGAAREAYERALAALPGFAPACWSLEPILMERGDAPALRRVQLALARGTQQPIERAARALRAAALAAPQDDELRAAWPELAALSAIDALLCDRELRPTGERAQHALADALEAAGHGASGALSDLAALRAAAIYEQCDEPARAAVLYREVRDRTRGDGGHAELGLERALSGAGLAALLADQLQRACTTARGEPAQRAASERLALHHLASGDEGRAVRAFRDLRALSATHVAALRALQRNAMRENDLDELAATADSLAERTRDPRERAAQQRMAARVRALRGEPPGPPPSEHDAQLGLWHAIELERRSRQRDDGQLTAQAVLLLCAHLPDPNQRASYALRAAEALEPISPALAIDALEPQALAAQNHPFAFEALGRLRHAAGDPAQAAADYEHAARAAAVPERSARLWYRAASLWEEAGLAVARTRTALEHVVRIDPLYRDAFVRLRRLLAEAGDAEGLARLYERRVAAGGEPRALAALNVERARVLLSLGDRAGARLAFGEALTLDPQRIDALRAAAELDLEAGRVREAAESLIQLARVAQDREVLRACFLELGRIYLQHVPDLRRAEIAFARAVSLEPNDRAAIEQLMQIYGRKREHDKALRACQRLIDLAHDDVEVDRRTVELAAIYEDMNDTRWAERVLNARREQSPGAPAILIALADLYARQRDHAALAVHLDRSVHALREALVDHPGDARRWSALCDVLIRRGRNDAAAHIAGLAHELGVADAQLAKLAAPRRGLGAAAIEADTVGRIWHAPASDPARALLRWLEPLADELLPVPAGQRIDAAPPVLAAAVAGARSALGLPDVTLFAEPGTSCVPLRNKPLAISIGRRLLATCDDEELSFLLMRAAAVARLGLLCAARTDPEELDALLAAVRGGDNGSDGAPDQLLGLARGRLSERLNPKRRAELAGLAAKVAVKGTILHAHALELGARAALVASGALGPALCALAACAADPAPEHERRDPVAAALEHDEARALLRFALSEAYMDLHVRPRSSARPGAQR